MLQLNNGPALQGGIVFKNWQAVAWLDPFETQKANWLLGEEKGTVTLEGQADGGIYTYSIDNRKAKIEAEVNGEAVKFRVKVRTDGILLQEQKRFVDLSLPQNINDLEKVFSDLIKKQIHAAVYKSQKDIGVDYLGFGMSLYNTRPKIYSRLNWNAVYPNVPVEVEVETHISRFGLSI